MRRTIRRTRFRITSLPHDLLVEIATQLASASSTPLLDMKNLRATCKMFHAASQARQVGKSMPVYKERNKHWWDKEGYFEFLGHCARSGNLEATYIIGLEHMCNLRRKVTGFRLLQRAVAGGHLGAAYTLGVLCFCVPATRSLGMELLNRVASGDVSNNIDAASVEEYMVSGNPNVDRCRREAVKILRTITMNKVMSLQPKFHCGNQRCGEIVEGSNMWLPTEMLHRRFCSQECRWRDEIFLFSTFL